MEASLYGYVVYASCITVYFSTHRHHLELQDCSEAIIFVVSASMAAIKYRAVKDFFNTNPE